MKNVEQAEAGFWLLVALNSKLSGNLHDTADILRKKFPKAYEEFSAINRCAYSELAQLDIPENEKQARFKAIGERFIAELAAKANG